MEITISLISGYAAYHVAVAAAVGGTFDLLDASKDFVLGAGGGIAVGIAVGWLIT